jgi:glycosyltransferase involved in cell wall biosynthesis
VIIASKRKACLEQCLASLDRQKYPSDMFEIIVVSPEKFVGKNTLSIAVRNIVDSKSNQAEARNIAEKSARGEILAFCDDDCVVPEHWIESGVKHFSDEAVATVGGPGIPPDHNVSFRQLLSGSLMKSFLGTGSHRRAYEATGSVRPHLCRPVEIVCANMFVDRLKFREVGGFDRIVPQEEDRLNTRFLEKGFKLVYDPTCFNEHCQRAYGLGFVCNIFWLMVGQGSLAASRLSPSSLYYLVPSAFVVGLVAGPFLFFIPFVSLLYFSALILYAVVVIGESLHLALKLRVGNRSRLFTFLTLPFTFLIHHIVSGCGFLSGFLKQSGQKIKSRLRGK